jgi:hypothetical protein
VTTAIAETHCLYLPCEDQANAPAHCAQPFSGREKTQRAYANVARTACPRHIGVSPKTKGKLVRETASPLCCLICHLSFVIFYFSFVLAQRRVVTRVLGNDK